MLWGINCLLTCIDQHCHQNGVHSRGKDVLQTTPFVPLDLFSPMPGIGGASLMNPPWKYHRRLSKTNQLISQ